MLGPRPYRALAGHTTDSARITESALTGVKGSDDAALHAGKRPQLAIVATPTL